MCRGARRMQPINSITPHCLDRDDSRMPAKKFCKRGRKSAKGSTTWEALASLSKPALPSLFGYMLWPANGNAPSLRVAFRLRPSSQACFLISFSFLVLMTQRPWSVYIMASGPP